MKRSKFISSAHTGATKEGESKDCVVRAVSNVTGMHYDTAHALLKSCGRKDRHAVPMEVSIKLIEKLGYSCVTFGKGRCANYLQYRLNKKLGGSAPRKTLSKLVSELPKGKFIVYVRGHATALVDGQIIDTFDNKANVEVQAIFFHAQKVFD